MKIALCNMPLTVDSFHGREFTHYEQSEQSMDLAYIASYLEKHDYPVDVIESDAIDLSVLDLVERVVAYDVLFILVEKYTYHNLFQFALKLRKKRKIALIFVGTYASFRYTDLLRFGGQESAFCILGNNEETALQIIKYLTGSIGKEELRNIAYWSEGTIRKTEQLKTIPLSHLPPPKITYISSGNMAGIETSRGCNNSCIYCNINANNQLGYKREIEYKSSYQIVEEIDRLVNNYGVKYIRFHDENFLVSTRENKKRILELCYLLKKRAYDIHFKIFARAIDIINAQALIEALVEVGLEAVFIGVESFVQRQLDFYRKNTTVEQNWQALNMLKERKINYTIGFLLLDPYVHISEIRTNLSELRKLKYEESALYMNLPISCIPELSAIPGTEFYKTIQTDQLLDNSEKGYRYVDQSITIFHEKKKEWERYTLGVQKQFYLIYLAYKKGSIPLAQELCGIRNELFRLDIQVLDNLCCQIQENKRAELPIQAINAVQSMARHFDYVKEALEKQ